MRKEYDFSKGERGKFYGKVDTKNPVIEAGNEISEDVERRIGKTALAERMKKINHPKSFS